MSSANLNKLIVHARMAKGAPYVHGPGVVHEYGCPITRHGKKYGPCNCGTAELQKELNLALRVAGLDLWCEREETTERIPVFSRRVHSSR